MAATRKCPACDGPIGYRNPPPDSMNAWTSFWAGRTVCPGCRTAVRMHLGLLGQVGRMVLLAGGAAVVFLVTRPLPDPWGLLAFLLLFTPVLVAVTALGQWVRWAYGTPIPLLPAGPSPKAS